MLMYGRNQHNTVIILQLKVNQEKESWKKKLLISDFIDTIEGTVYK